MVSTGVVNCAPMARGLPPEAVSYQRKVPEPWADRVREAGAHPSASMAAGAGIGFTRRLPLLAAWEPKALEAESFTVYFPGAA